MVTPLPLTLTLTLTLTHASRICSFARSGKLAEKAFTSVLPNNKLFPYFIKVSSEIMGSDGSSSMATVCGTSLALFDAGIPMKSAVAGVSIGLVQREDNDNENENENDYTLLTDLRG